MPILRYLLISLGILVTVNGCSTATTAVVNNSTKAAATIDKPGTFRAKQNRLFRAPRITPLYQSSHEIESIAGVEPWLVWTEDDVDHLLFAKIDEQTQSLDVKTLSPLEHDADLLCIGQNSETVLDVFVHDGDAYFHHYWFQPETSQLQWVRKLATNPDVEQCVVTPDALLYLDPYLGPLSIKRNAETDPIVYSTTAEQAALLSASDALAVNFQSDSSKLQRRLPTVVPVLETQPVADSGDAADDPVVLVGENKTWIVGTNKQRGLAVYNLDGQQIHFSPRGRLNNVDAVKLSDNEFLLAATNRTDKTIDLFRANLATNTFRYTANIALNMDDPYGLCMAFYEGGVSVFPGDSEGQVQHWQLNSDLAGGSLQQTFKFNSQTEGCVMDTQTNQLYIGEEALGIWQFDLDSGKRELIKSVDEGNLVADVEGMDIYYGADRKVLVVSSQGDDSYVLYDLNNGKLLSKFQIVGDVSQGIDGASETDGLAVSASAIPGFPNGVLVVQDGRNRAPTEAQNFKVIDWRSIQALIN